MAAVEVERNVSSSELSWVIDPHHLIVEAAALFALVPLNMTAMVGIGVQRHVWRFVCSARMLFSLMDEMLCGQ